MNNGQTLVELEHVSQVYATGRKRFYAIQDINLSINEGEFVCLLGPSGCGKSTLLRLITGLQRPTEGVVRYRGQELRGVNPHASIVFQTFALFPWLSVQENVEVALKARGVPPKLRTARALDLLDRVGLDGFENAYPRELSGGMRQKWDSPAPWRWSRSCCVWTSRFPRWMCSARKRCVANSWSFGWTVKSLPRPS